MAIPTVEEQNDAGAPAAESPYASSMYRCSPSSSSIHRGNDKKDDVEFEILFQHAAESPWEETTLSAAGDELLLHDVFVDGDDVSSLYHHTSSNSCCSPMERGEATGCGASSLPSAEEVRGWVHLLEAQKKKSRGGTGDEEEQTGICSSRRNKSLIVALCAFLAITLIALIAGFAARQDAPRAAAAAGNAASVHDAEALPPRRSNYTEVMEFVVEHGVSSLKDFKDMSSPQARAVSWMAYVDAANLAVPSTIYNENDAPSSSADDDDDEYHDDYLARYALAVLYFATTGENWFQQFNFLTKGDVCTWMGDVMDASGTKSIPYGVDCDEDGTVRGLYLGM
jgi:hypothetical protein